MILIIHYYLKKIIFSPADNNLVDHISIDYSINDDDNNLVDDHIDEVFIFLCLI